MQDIWKLPALKEAGVHNLLLPPRGVQHAFQQVMLRVLNLQMVPRVLKMVPRVVKMVARVVKMVPRVVNQRKIL
jgi:hypothetical protein